jgi:hypothetical protein
MNGLIKIRLSIKFNRQDRECLNEIELTAIKARQLKNPIPLLVHDLFVFSCYTGWLILI